MPNQISRIFPGGTRARVAILAALALAALCALPALVERAPAQGAADELQAKVDELERVQSRQSELSGGIEEQNAAIDSMIGELRELRGQVSSVREELAAKQAALDEATAQLERERVHLAAVRARLRRAITALEELLVTIYKSNEPDVLSIVMQSSSWSEVLAESEYWDSIEDHDSAVIERVEGLRDEIRELVARLTETRDRVKSARDEIAERERELSAAQDRMLARRAELVAARAAREQELERLGIKQQELSKDLALSAPPGQATLLPNGDALAPPNAPLVVRAAIDAANQINDLPYVWGGGHGSFESSGYDCSGAVSYALHGGGLLDSPLDSTGLMFWGESGPGSWITVFAHSGHTYAVIAGLRWDTSGGAGPRWHSDMRSPAGFVARHPSGL